MVHKWLNIADGGKKWLAGDYHHGNPLLSNSRSTLIMESSIHQLARTLKGTRWKCQMAIETRWLLLKWPALARKNLKWWPWPWPQKLLLPYYSSHVLPSHCCLWHTFGASANRLIKTLQRNVSINCAHPKSMVVSLSKIVILDVQSWG